MRLGERHCYELIVKLYYAMDRVTKARAAMTAANSNFCSAMAAFETADRETKSAL